MNRACRVGVAVGSAVAAAIAPVIVDCGRDEPVSIRPSNSSAAPAHCTRSVASVDSGAPIAGPRRFRKIVLTTQHYSESAAYGDLNCDGVMDLVAGPFWYQGPDFASQHIIYPPVVYDPHTFSDNFVAFTRDFSGDGWDDVLVTHGSGRSAEWFENPRSLDGIWARHVVVDVVDNESPTFTDLTGDGLPELVFHVGGQLGWAEPDWNDAVKPWLFHPLSPPLGLPSATHGLGVGDVDHDGRLDVLLATGYWLQPSSLAGDPIWEQHPESFGQGGAQMYAYDVDGDGDSDVVTIIWAHGLGLSWFEQTAGEAGPTFVEHEIVPSAPTDAGVIMFGAHAMALQDMDGDGLDDLVTGERFWGHVPEGDADLSAPARLYWFRLIRDSTGAHYDAALIDDQSGVGGQVAAGDATADGLADILVSTKKGAFFFAGEVAN